MTIACNDDGKIVDLTVYDQLFAGTISSVIGRLSSLTYLAMSNGKISSSIPSEIGLLTDLEYLELDQNRLFGTIPRTIERLTELQYMTLAFNSLTGPVPDLAAMSRLTFLELVFNGLSGDKPAVPSSLTQCRLAAAEDPTGRLVDSNCFANCDNTALCCLGSRWPCDGSLSTATIGGIAGGAVAGLIVIVAIIVAIIVFRRRSQKNQEALKVTNAGYLQTVVSYAAASEEANAGQTDTAAAGGNTAPVLRATPLYGDLEVQPYNNVGPQFTAQYTPHYVATGYQPTPNPNH